MKIRLSETQYNRLLCESSSYDKQVLKSSPIGDKITKPIVKIFLYLYGSGKHPFDTSYLERENPLLEKNFKKIVEEIDGILNMGKPVSIILAHNYCSVYNNEIVNSYENNDITPLLNNPIHFYGKYEYPINVFYSGYVTGSSDGKAIVYATNLDMFKEKFQKGEVDIEEDSRSGIDYDYSSIDFERDWDHTYNSLEYIDLEEDLISVTL